MGISFVFLGILWIVGSLILLKGLRYIPANPPHVALVTKRGVPTGEFKRSGWRFFLFYPWWYGYILVNITKKNRDIMVKLRTPDRVELEVPVGIAFAPNPYDLRAYVRSGGEEGSAKQLEGMVKERLREWAFATEEGPQSWQEALGAREEAEAVILKMLADNLDPVSAPVPTAILMKFFAGKKPTKHEAHGWGQNWKKVRTWFDGLAPALQERVREQVGKRRKKVREMRQGRGTAENEGLGVILTRLNIDEIKPLGKVAEKASRKAEEEEERAANDVRLAHLNKKVEELMKLGFSHDAAAEIVQIETGRVTKTVSESLWNLSAETRGMIEKIVPGALDRLFGGKKGKGESDG